MSIRPFYFTALLVLPLLAGPWGCSHGQELRTSTASASLADALSEVPGRFAWRDDLRRYVYSESAQLEKIVSAYKPEDALRSLVACLDDSRLSNSTLENKPVAVGVVCYQALSQIAYHEKAGPKGDISPEWAGHIGPKATAEERAAAKKAWEKVLKEGSYHFL